MKHKKLFISLTAVLAVLVFFGIFLLTWFVGDDYPGFKKFTKEFAIEGLDDGAIPQGLTAYYGQYKAGTDENGKDINKYQQYFLTSAYMKDGSPSRIYVTGTVTGYMGYVTMLNTDGTPHMGHVGGIATNASTLWVTYGDSILVAKASSKDYSNILAEIVAKATINSDLGEGEEFQTIQFTASFKANCRASYLYYYHDPRYSNESYDRLYVGEFYRKGNYETAASHRLETPNGYKNTSFMYDYRADSTSGNKYGLYLIDSSNNNQNLSENVPKIQKIYSMPEKIQGLAFSGRSTYGTTTGTMVLSQSYGLSNSHLLCFDWSKVNAKSKKYTELSGGVSFEYDGVYTVGGGKKSPYTDSSLYVYYADMNDSDMYLGDYSIPSMSEGMCTVTLSGYNKPTQERIYVLFESGSKKYNLFTRESIKHVYSFIPKESELK